MLILGIDPGSQKTGYGLIEAHGNKVSYLDSGVIRYNLKEDFFNRLGEIHLKTIELVKKTSPDCIALESLIYVKSPTAIIKLSQSRGVMLAAFLAEYKNRIFEYSPNLIKSTVSGHGHASKEGVQKMLQMILGKSEFETDDESDALAIAICHAIHRNSDIPRSKSKSIRKSSSLAQALEHKVKQL